MDLEEYFGDEDNVFKELSVVRSAQGLKSTTPEQWEAMDKVMGLIWLYRPESIDFVVDAAFSEFHTRKTYAETGLFISNRV